MTLFIGNSYITPTILVNVAQNDNPVQPQVEIPTTLGSRIDNKATVVGTLQDHEGNTWVYAVVDAKYRSDTPMSWSLQNVATGMFSSANYGEMRAANYTGTYYTNYILENLSIYNYPAFEFAKNACTISLNGNTYHSVLPTFNELYTICGNKALLDTYDPTLEEYPNLSLTKWQFDGSEGSWSANEAMNSLAWYVYLKVLDKTKPDYNYTQKSQQYGICPVIEIPLTS